MAGSVAWAVDSGLVGLYCPTSMVLVAALVPVDAMPDLASQLPLR